MISIAVELSSSMTTVLTLKHKIQNVAYFPSKKETKNKIRIKQSRR